MATTAPPNKQMQLNLYEVACIGIPNTIRQWKCLLSLPSPPTPSSTYPNPNPAEYPTITRAPKTASPTGPDSRLAEKGKIRSIFLADAYGELEVYQGKADAQYQSGRHVAKFELTLLGPAMIAVTKSVGFGVTGSTSYVLPYRLVRD
jgi:hypothetical protein